MLLHGITVPHAMQFSTKGTEAFMKHTTEKFNACIDKMAAANNAKNLKEALERQYRNNFFEYLLRGICCAPPFPERNELIEAVFQYAEKTESVQ